VSGKWCGVLGRRDGGELIGVAVFGVARDVFEDVHL
jgi:hypothetical protein